ncbi:MAG: NAD-dependent DNA ligase LigA [Chloroflexota bacterium]|nr:NAD-dependent DNA ligase LigA [Chloroflexota bacterium]
MSVDELRNEYKELKDNINYHNYRYHVLDDPVISDYEFDRKLNRLKAIEAEHPDWITPDSPTQRAGAQPLEKFEKVAHPAPILSLANAFNEKGIRDWLARVAKLDNRVNQSDFTVEPKLDGLTVVLRYENGIFVQGATRGNGNIGEDITENLRTIKALPLHIPVTQDAPEVPEVLIVRGEALITKDDFKSLNKRLEESGQKTYLNPRNTAAGSLRQLDSKNTAQRPLTLLIYAIVHHENDDIPDTQWQSLNFLRKIGFPVAEASQYCQSLEDAIQLCMNTNPDAFPFEVDGMVIKINDLALAESLGTAGKDPRGAIAYKFPAEEITTKLLDIGVNVGRTGVITPYAILEPVEIGGVVVRQATLHNFDFIAEKDIRIGDRVLVKRAGEVIPYIIGPIEDMRIGEEVKYRPPRTCPSCGDPLVNPEGEVAYYCTNSACPAQLMRNLEHFVSRSAMDIVGLGINIVVQLVEAGLLKDFADLYKLEKADLLTQEGFADKKADNLVNAIQASKVQPLFRLITGLGIRGVGEVAAQDLARRYHSLGELRRATRSEIESIPGFGPNIAESIVNWFQNEENQVVLQKLRDNGVWPVAEQEEERPRPLKGLTFVVTGSLPNLSRSEVKTLIESHGGKVTGSVSSRTSYLVLGENPGSKYAQAQKHNIPILSEDDLQHLIQEGTS